MTTPAPIITISASYGAGGSYIAPRLATRLGLPFIDRMISVSVSDQARVDQAAGHSQEHVTKDEEKATPSRSIFAYFARAASAGALLTPPEMVVDEEEQLRAEAEPAIEQLCADGGVLLGRAGAVVLAGRDGAFHVRLDGPAERRITQAADLEGIDRKLAADRQVETDKIRTFYVRRLYRSDPTEPRWYHLLLDTTVISRDAAVELIAGAFEAFRAAGPS